MPPKKLQPSNLLPPLPEGSTGVSVLVGVGATVGVVGAAVGLVVGAAVVVVVELKFLFKNMYSFVFDREFLNTKLQVFTYLITIQSLYV